MTPKGSSPVRRGAVGKGPQGTSLAAYPTPTFACNGLSSQSNLDQPRYKTWQHVRKPDTEGKGDSP